MKYKTVKSVIYIELISKTILSDRQRQFRDLDSIPGCVRQFFVIHYLHFPSLYTTGDIKLTETENTTHSFKLLKEWDEINIDETFRCKLVWQWLIHSSRTEDIRLTGKLCAPLNDTISYNNNEHTISVAFLLLKQAEKNIDNWNKIPGWTVSVHQLSPHGIFPVVLCAIALVQTLHWEEQFHRRLWQFN